MFKNILLPTDGSPLAQKAVTLGVNLARLSGAKVTGFVAAPPATPIVYRNHLPVGFAQPAEQEQMIAKMTAEYLGLIEQAAKQAGVPFEGAHKIDDYPADAILEIAQKKGCDLIVMATQGSGGMRGVLVGSVAQKVLNQAKVPVMTIR
jgi:nucleotide-binding universal stress UspA family protein